VRIVLDLYLGREWLAGLTSVICIGSALRALGDRDVEVILATWPGAAPEIVAQARPYVTRVIEAPTRATAVAMDRPRRYSPAWLRDKIARRPAPVRRLSPVYRDQQVDCVFSTPRRRPFDIGVPRLVWVPDFQHHHLPDLFPPKQLRRLDALYRCEAASASRVFVTAESVRQDFRRFAPELAERVRVLPFVVPVADGDYAADPAEVAARYHLPARYFFLANQFWKHKNHGLVLEALGELRRGGLEAYVVCTGHLHDWRHPAYVSELFQQVSVSGLQPYFIALGVLPYTDVLQLMRQSVYVLSPSLFEGFDLSVGEARSLGKGVLLSDLPAHREQAPPGGVYFDPHDASDLAGKMAEIWRKAAPGPDPALEAQARAALPLRQRAFAQGFLALAREAQAAAPGLATRRAGAASDGTGRAPAARGPR
jgi:glycosyltransferase involved in cell wall biosynthesis